MAGKQSGGFSIDGSFDGLMKPKIAIAFHRASYEEMMDDVDIEHLQPDSKLYFIKQAHIVREAMSEDFPDKLDMWGSHTDKLDVLCVMLDTVEETLEFFEKHMHRASMSISPYWFLEALNELCEKKRKKHIDDIRRN